MIIKRSILTIGELNDAIKAYDLYVSDLQFYNIIYDGVIFKIGNVQSYSDSCYVELLKSNINSSTINGLRNAIKGFLCNTNSFKLLFTINQELYYIFEYEIIENNYEFLVVFFLDKI